MYNSKKKPNYYCTYRLQEKDRRLKQGPALHKEKDTTVFGVYVRNNK